MLAQLLLDDGMDVRIFGFDSSELDFIKTNSLDEALQDTDIIIGPLPFSDDSGNLFTPLYSKKIGTDEIFDLMDNKQVFLGGKVNEYRSNVIDYFEREEMQILNAIPTAEGAVQIAMEEMKVTLFDSNALVLGFGRIGKILAKIIYGLGANTYVTARKYSDIAWISSYGYKPILLKELGNVLPNMDVVFNTIPSIVLDEEMLSKLNEKSLVIDVASKPGGVDFKKAEEMGIKTIWALGLPGKVAPITAAKIIKETIYNIIEELEV